MFGCVMIRDGEKPGTMSEKIRNSVRALRGVTDVKMRETEVCGLHLYRCEVCLPHGVGESRRDICVRNAARKLYRAGVKCAAVSADCPDADLLRESGVRIADASKLYREMALPLLRRLMDTLELPYGEGHLIVYALQASREVLSFCESVVHAVRYLTVIGPGLIPNIQQRLLDHYGIASCPRAEDGSLSGDILVCFDALDARVELFAPRISVRGALLPYGSREVVALDAFVKVNGADFSSAKYAPYAVGDRNTDQTVMAFLQSGGFLKCRDLCIEELRWDDAVIAEK